jgi:hypothetical protein
MVLNLSLSSREDAVQVQIADTQPPKIYSSAGGSLNLPRFKSLWGAARDEDENCWTATFELPRRIATRRAAFV